MSNHSTVRLYFAESQLLLLIAACKIYNDDPYSQEHFLCLAEVQPILEPPVLTELSDTTATITWTGALGDVEMYIILYTHIAEDREFNATTNDSDTSFTLIGLEPLSEYSLVILTVNFDGDTAASPFILFTTYGALKPK